MSADHNIVYLNATEEDYAQDRSLFEEIRKLRDFLCSSAAVGLDPKIKNTLLRYLDSKTKTLTEKNLMDALNLDTDVVANDIGMKMREEMRKTGLEHEIQTLLSIEENSSSLSTGSPQQSNPVEKIFKILSSFKIDVDEDNNVSDIEEEHVVAIQPSSSALLA